MSDLHEHNHAAQANASALGVAIVLNVAITAIEAGIGLHVHSLALLADALHNLTDVGALALAWVGARLALRPASARRTYGLLRAEPLIAFLNSLVLLPLAGSLLWVGVQRLGTTAAPPGPVVMLVGAIALVANAASALVLRRHAGADLGTRSALLHLVTDAAASAAVILGGVLLWAGFPFADPVLSIAIGILSAWSVARVIGEALHVLAEGAPDGASASQVATTLCSVPGITAVHHVHVWTISTRLRAASAHLVVPDGLLSAAAATLRAAQERLLHEHGIGHATLQLEAFDCDDQDVVADPRTRLAP